MLCVAFLTQHSFGARFRTWKGRSDTYRQRLENFKNTQYWGNLSIGGQKMLALFDTGSFETVVRSRRCEQCVHNSPPYDHSKSSTYVENGTVETHIFGYGPGSGRSSALMGYERIEIGHMAVQKQAFWEILRDWDVQTKSAAIVGIGPGCTSRMSGERTLLAAYDVEEFSICLERGSGRPGWLTWGPTALDSQAKHFLTVPVDGKFHWAAKLKDVYFGLSKKPVPPFQDGVCADGCAALMDSGSSLIAGPTSALHALSQQLGMINEDCSNLHQLPALKFSMGNHEFEVPPHAYVLRVKGALLSASNVWDLLFFKPKMRKLDMCIPAFMSLNVMSQFGPVWVFGMPFFRYYHSTFDRSSKTMRFARASEDCKPMPATNSSQHSFVGSGENVDFEPVDMQVETIIPARISSMLEPGGEDHRVTI